MVLTGDFAPQDDDLKALKLCVPANNLIAFSYYEYLIFFFTNQALFLSKTNKFLLFTIVYL